VTQQPIIRVSKEETGKMKSEIAELAERHSRLSSDLSKRKERIADLMAELSVAQSEAEQAKSEAETLRASVGTSQFSTRFSFDGASIKEILDDIVALEGIKMALIADDYGLVVEAVGEGLPSDTVAAISNLVERLGPQVREILPMGEVSTVSLGDDQGLVLDTRYFDLFGVRCALAIARYEDFPYPGLAKKAIESVVSSMDE
jgi:predicted regulator of Ras-like GTPase activity (Roadblock/LC7/MglB family)